MRAVIGMALVVMIVACTRPNPQDCADGLCTDPAYPFCDIDGALEGEIKTCIAVTCTPGEFRACRDDVAITCNNVGNDYDLVQCELGCGPAGCRSCTDNEQCANPTAVCDATDSVCRACKVDDECTSKICDAGSCASGAGVLYASPTGSGTSDCSLSAPCELNRVLGLVNGVAVPPRVRLLPGTYPGGIVFSKVTPVPFEIVATGATLAASTALEISDGASLKIRGLTTLTTSTAIQCGSMTTSRSKLVLEQSVIRASSGLSGLVYAYSCEIKFYASELDMGSSTGTAVNLLAETVFAADRSWLHGTERFPIATFGDRIGVSVTNSVLERVDTSWVTGSADIPAHELFAFNTIVLGDLMLNCRTNSSSPYRTLDYQNNIIVSSKPSAIDGTTCKLTRNIIWPGPAIGTSSIIADPQFVDAGAKDFRITASSPAVDAAMTEQLYLITADFDGTPRPQGPAPDIGAYERVP